MAKLIVKEPFKCVIRNPETGVQSWNPECENDNAIVGTQLANIGSALEQSNDYVPPLARSKSHSSGRFLRIASSHNYFGESINGGAYAIVAVDIPEDIWENTSTYDC